MGDKDLENYLQEIAGMCAVGKVMSENLIIAFGGGGNGKSTLFNLLSRVLGDYAGMISSVTLTANRNKNISPELAELRGKRIVIAAELGDGAPLDSATVKKISSTDSIQAEKKYHKPFHFIPSHNIILYTNFLPKIRTNDNGTWDRIIAVPFNARFRGTKGEIKNYAEYLLNHCGGSVLTWIIEGAKRYIENGYNLQTPACVKEAVAKYRKDNDWLDAYLDARCVVGPTYRQKSQELYQDYRLYCDTVGDRKRSLADFKQGLAQAGFETHKTNKGAIIYGLKLTEEHISEKKDPNCLDWDDYISLSA